MAICELYYFNGDIEELLDSLHIMHQVESERRAIKVSTLNFSGINTSPFEYFDGNEQTKRISEHMKEILEIERSALSDKMGIIDKKYRTNKMSIRYCAGVCEEPKLPGKEEFIRKWREEYNKDKPADIVGDTEDIIESVILFDYYCYISVVKEVYGVEWTAEPKEDSHMTRDYVIKDI
jgi:hypothetical protein